MRPMRFAVCLLLLSGNVCAKELGACVHTASLGGPVTRDAKLRWARMDVTWLDAQPSQGAPNFASYDAKVDAAIASGLKVLLIIAYAPVWASQGDTKGGGSQNDLPKVGAYAAFTTEVVNHFKNRVTHYEI